MKTNIMAIGLAVIIAACNPANETEVRTSPSGNFEFTVLRDVEGEPAKHGDVIIIDVTATDGSDSVWIDRKDVPFRKDTARWKNGGDGFWEILWDVSPEDSLKITLDVATFLNLPPGQPLPPFAQGVDSFTVNLRVDEITTMEAYNDKLMQQEEERLKEELGEDYISPEEQLQAEYDSIEAYLDKTGIEAEKLDNGLYIAITEKGDGPTAQSGQTIRANYAGYLLDSSYFDTSVREIAEAQGLYNPQRPYEPFEFTIDESSVIEGWHVAFKELREGDKATVFIPSGMGYGRRGNGPRIPPNTTLIFDLELVEIVE